MIIVTGANGFIGSALVWELNQAGQQGIVCVDTVGLRERPGPLRRRTYRKFLGKDELWDFLKTPEANRSVTAVLHMGACSSTTEMDVAFLKENNFEYTRRLWHWCTEHQKTFIYASSGAVYGSGAQGFDDASSPDLFQPLNPYGESKAAFDRWVVRETKAPPLWLGLRFFNVYGPNEYHKGDMASVVFKAFAQIKDHASLELFRSHRADYKDGEQKRDFVYIKDITRWVLELLVKKQVKSGIYNMGYGTARTWLDLASAIFKSMPASSVGSTNPSLGLQTKIDWIEIPKEMQARYQYFTEAKIDRLIRLGISPPEWSIERGVADYVTNYLTPMTDPAEGYL